MTDDQLLLASAYVDDDVDDAARARAEADPEVMAEVARLGALRAELRDTGTPDAARREQAIEAALAALAAFADDASAPARPPAPVPLPRRQHRAWWGGALAAAAALVVVVAGAVVLRGTGGSDGDDSSSAEVTTHRGADERPAPTPRRRPRSRTTPRPRRRRATPRAPPPRRRATEATAAADTAPSEVARARAGPVDTAGARDVRPRGRRPLDGGGGRGRRRASSPARSSAGRPTTARAVEVFVDGDVVTAADATTCAVVVLVGP